MFSANKAIIQTLYATGVRLSELVNLKVTDIDSNRMVVRVDQGKGKKDRYVMLSKILLATLREYWKDADPKPKTYLFPGTHLNKHFSKRPVQRIIKETTLRAHIDKTVTPHIHCVIPGGGLSPDKLKWISSAKRFFVPVRKLSKVFRGKFLSCLEKMHKAGALVCAGNISDLRIYKNFKALLKKSCITDWNVYTKPPFKGPHWALRYLARYTHKIAISNSRIIGIKDGKVAFTYRDRKHGNVKKVKLLDVVTFMQKFLLHVLPPKFVRIRYYGFLGNTVKKKNLALIRNLLGDNSGQTDNQEDVPSGWVDIMIFLTGKDPTICKKCKSGHMINLNTLANTHIRYG